jgi:hypothetical protein
VPIFSALRRRLLRSFPLMLGASAFLIFSSGWPLPFSLSAATAVTAADQITGVITNPSPQAQVPEVQTVAGTVTGLTAEKHLWLLVVPHVPGAAAYHPEPDLTVNGSNWTVTARIGLAGDLGRVFDLELVVADNQADASFRQYLNTATAKGSYPGMPILPQGVLLLQSVEVQREGGSVGGGGIPWWIFVLAGVGAVGILAIAASLVRRNANRKRLIGDD